LARGAEEVRTQAASSLGFPADLARHNVIRPAICLQTLQCLADVERTAHACPAAARIAPAWKTGTSSGHRDAWCAAVTPRRTVVVWLGNPDGSGADALVGQEAAAPLALQILAAADAVPDAGFAPPAGFEMARDESIANRVQPVSLAMVSPSNGQEIVRDPSLSPERQRFLLRAKTVDGDSAVELWWFVDGECVAHGRGAEPLWWLPVAGTHRVSVVDAAGRADSAEVRVRE
jgi:penicillin-binding protein 1C